MLTSAADLTTRFLYVSPPATLIDRDGRSHGHAVDGGYFENLGATTALEVMRALHETLRDWERSGDLERSAFAKRVVPIAVQIASSTTLPAHLGKTGVPAEYGSKDLRYGTEALAPPKTLFETRGARGVLATAHLRRLAESSAVEGGPAGLYLLLRTHASDVDPPTGRILSETTRETINAYLLEERNAANIKALIEALGDGGLSQ